MENRIKIYLVLGIMLTGFSFSYAQEIEKGKASFYADALKGRKTASGERYNPAKFTAAHPRLQFGTRVCVENLENGKTVEVRINDRGPFASKRIIDVSRAAAQELGFIRQGTARVKLRVLAK